MAISQQKTSTCSSLLPDTHRCKECPFPDSEAFQGIPGPDFSDPDGVCVVLESPRYSTKADEYDPWAGTSSQLFLKTLEAAQVPIKWITNALACKPPYKAKVDSQVRFCSNRLFREIQEVKPKVIVTAGLSALKAFMPKVRSITKHRGIPFWHEDSNCWVMPTFHPAAVLQEPDRFRDLADDIERLNFVDRWGQKIEDPEIIEITTWGQFEKHLPTLLENPLAVDIETTGLNAKTDKVVAVGLSVGPHLCFVLYKNAIEKYQKTLKRILEENKCTGGHNAPQFDAKFLYHHYGIDWRPTWDTMLLHYTLDERQSGHSLEHLSQRFLGTIAWKTDIVALVRDGDRKDELLLYLARDCCYTYMLWQKLKVLCEEEGLTSVHEDILVPGSTALGRMELNGIRIDTDYLEGLGRDFQKQYIQLLEEIREESGFPDFNPNSPKQVAELLYDHFKLPSTSRSTSKEVLENLDHPIVKKILDARQKLRFTSTYVDGLIKRMGNDGKLYSEFPVFATATGRLASRNPNLQNIPQISEEGRRVRNAFIPNDDTWTLIEADYSQLELRVAGILSNDEKLIETYVKGEDIHTKVASEVFHVPMDEVTYEQRYVAKYIDFGILYGRQAPSLARGELQCSVKEAQSYIDTFLGQFTGLKVWIEKQHKQAIEQGYVQSLFGRKRRFPLILSDNITRIKNQAVNTPIQSLASDICLHALGRLQLDLLDPKICKILLTVHDSILFECHPDHVDEMVDLITVTMEDVPLSNPPLPFKVDVEVAKRWGETKG